MPHNEGDGRIEHQRQLWSARDLAAHGLAFHIAKERKDGLGALGAAVHDLETARIIALEGIGFGAAFDLVVKRVGTSDEQVVRWAEEFLDAWAARVAHDGFEGASADTLAGLRGEYKERPPRSLADIEELI